MTPAYRLSRHAGQRMIERHVSDADVEEVLASPDSARHDPNQRSYRLEKRLPKGVLKVWVVQPWPPKGIVLVKSVAWKD